MTRRWYLLMLLALLTVGACTKDERDPCLQPRTTLLRAHAYRRADTGSASLDTLLPNPLLIPLNSTGTQYIFTGGKKISRLSLTLSDVADTCSWILRPDSASAVQDTLTFYYQRQLRFLSNACGYTYFYNLQRVRVSNHVVDSAIILRADITNDANVENLKLYF